MKRNTIYRKWLLPFENRDYSPFDWFLGLLPFPDFSKVTKVSKLVLFFLIVDISGFYWIKNGQEVDVSRFTYISKAWDMGPKELDAVLNTYIEEQVTPTSSDGLTGKLSEVRHSMTSCEQFEMLSTVSNYHVLSFPSQKDPNKVTIPNVSLHKHITTPELKRYVPASPRNRIVYLIKSGEIQKLGYLLQFLNNTDKKDEIYTPSDPPPKKQHLTACRRGKCVDAFRIKEKYLSPELVKLIQLSNIDHSVYTTVKNQLLTSGVIRW